ncbi:MAG TPA: FtsW/RodA/SpoVE family cell cycle protein, partial [Candidatus Binataceae bacterium]|nr:FtsW/RodA/SpoVE family cell cycle protein [Candidatus Binataceae bacterium]
MRSAVAYFRSWFGRFERLTWRPPDPWLCIPAATLLALGLLMVLNTTYFLGQEKAGDPFHFFKAQVAHIAIGLLVCLPLSQFSLTGLRRLVVPLAAISLGLLIAVWIPGFGLVRGGARRWVRLGPLLAEPSELVKVALVFFLADFLSRRQESMREFKRGPLPAFLIVAPIALMLLRQPDFGTTVMVSLLTFAMLYAAGASPLHLGAAGGAAAALQAIQ